MASSVIGALRVNLGLDSAQFSKGIKKSEGDISQFHRTLLKLSAAAGTLVGGLFAVGALRNSADKWSDLSSRVGTAVGAMSQAPAIMDRISKMARSSYSDLGMTAEAFIANRTALADLGYSTAQQLDYTEALNNALVISGAKGDRAASVQNALSVAMATGKLAGDGLNTVLAHGGRVAQALAERLGTNVSGLRAMGSQGKITASVISGALLGSLQAVRDEAAEMPATIGDGFTLLSNAMLRLIGTFDQVSGASGLIASGIVAIADGIDWVTDAVVANSGLIVTALNTLAATAAIVGTVFATRYAVSVGVAAVNAMRGAIAQSIALEMALGAQSRAAAMAGVATKLLSGALTLLRGALLATGIGALVVGAGYLVAKFMELVDAAGGFGEALTLVGDVAREVWDRINLGLDGLGSSVASISEGIKASFTGAFAWILRKLADLTDSAARGINDMFSAIGWNPGLRGMGGGLAGQMDAAAEGARINAANSGQRAAAMFSAALAPLQSWAKLKEVMAGADAAADEAAASAETLGAKLDEAGKKGGGAAKKIADGMKEVVDRTNRGADRIGDMFGSLLDGSKSVGSAVRELIMEIAKMSLMRGFRMLFGAGGAFPAVGNWLGGLIGQNANGTNSWRGGLTEIHERGGEIMNLPRGTQIIPHDISKRMADAAGSKLGSITVYVDPSVIVRAAEGVAVRVVQAAQPGIVAGAVAATYDHAREVPLP